MSINKVMLIGRVGKDPDTHHLDGGNTLASFSLATSETYKDKNGNKVENTEWHNCRAWNKLAEIISKYVVKGQLIYIEGRLKTESWEKDGEKHYKTIIVVSNLQMLGGKPDSSGHAEAQKPDEVTPVNEFEPQEDDLPF